MASQKAQNTSNRPLSSTVDATSQRTSRRARLEQLGNAHRSAIPGVHGYRCHSVRGQPATLRVSMHTTIEPTTYVTGAEELVWGLVLLAISLTVHGFGMVVTLRTTGNFKRRFATTGRMLSGITTVILGSWMILAVQIVEVAMWAGFFQVGSIASRTSAPQPISPASNTPPSEARSRCRITGGCSKSWSPAPASWALPGLRAFDDAGARLSERAAAASRCAAIHRLEQPDPGVSGSPAATVERTNRSPRPHSTRRARRSPSLVSWRATLRICALMSLCRVPAASACSCTSR